MRRESKPRNPPAALGLIVLFLLLSWALRLHSLDGKSIWSDEGLSVYRARQSIPFIVTNKIVIQNVVTKDTQPPLYFVLLHLVRGVAGETEFALRFLSACFAALIVPLLYVVAKRLISPRAGWLAALLAAASPTYLWYAQEMRMYTMLVLISLLSVYCLLRLLDEPVGWRRSKVAKLAAYLLATGAMIYTHYSGFFLLLFQGALIAAFIIRSRRYRMMALMGLALAAASPLIPFALRRLAAGAERDFSFVPLDIILLDLLNGFAVGISVDLSNTVWLDALGLVVFILGLLVLRKDGVWGRWGKPLLLLGYYLIPILALFGVSHIKPMYMGVRHLIIVSPAYYLAAAAALDYLLRPKTRWVALLVGAVLLGGNVYATNNYFHDPAYVKDDLRSLARYVRQRYRPDDVVVLNDAVLDEVFGYYAPDLNLTAQPSYGQQAGQQTLRECQALSEIYERIWFVHAPPSTFYDPQQIVGDWFQDNLFRLDFRQFPGYGTEVGVSGFSSAPPILDQSPSEAAQSWLASLPADGSPLALLRYALPDGPTPSGDALPITLYWWLTRPAEAEYKVSARLVGPDGSYWAQTDSEFFYFMPMAAWPVGRPVQQVQDVLLPPGTPPGRYQVELWVYRADTGESLSIPYLHADGPAQPLALGAVEVGPAIRAEDLGALPPHDKAEARFADMIQLYGFTRADGVYVPGGVVHIDLYWRALRQPILDYDLRLRLVNEQGLTVDTSTATPVFAALPTSAWPAGDLVRGQANLTLPANLARGTYQLQAQLVEAQTGDALPIRRRWWQPWTVEELALARLEVREP
ncbi:MAG: phospholipid carrier-dependent glycosyltransferase [Chloroflexi bacterium]|nr:phospholipid carrier-dependent glycosyltransferase [Chloroflexota bacterium]